MSSLERSLALFVLESLLQNLFVKVKIWLMRNPDGLGLSNLFSGLIPVVTTLLRPKKKTFHLQEVKKSFEVPQALCFEPIWQGQTAEYYKF